MSFDSKGLIRRMPVYVASCFFLSGLTGLVYQILWTRMLGLVFGHTVFAVGTVLAAFMGGLALGSFLAGKWADRPASLRTKWHCFSPHLRAYGILEGLIGLYCLLTLWKA
ncbi:MAG: hypothetical protein HYU64_11650 [Armatimonadetes bacterium]|nr:hypothetical protein [Armatimonadota bacterium]